MELIGLTALTWTLMASAGQAAESARPTIDSKVESILDKLEAGGDEVVDLHCKVEYSVIDTLNLDEYTKYGEIRYLRDEPNPRFIVHFDKRVQGGTVNRDKEWWLFDGRWLWEVNAGSRQVRKQEMVRPGERIDFFDIETTPFPLPFGQKKDQILKNFNVTLEAPTPSDPPDTDHLHCVPKPTWRLAGEYDSFDFYIDKKLHLPRRIVATERKALKILTSSFPDLSAASINRGIDRDTFKPLKEWNKLGKPIVERLPKVETGGSRD